MRRPFVAGNWKMNGSAESAVALAQALRTSVPASVLERVDVAVCPPFVFIPAVNAALAGSGIALGAQNVSEHGSGAYTGEVSAPMLADVACTLVLVGHSERRHIYGESDAQVAGKFTAAGEAGLTPVLCVGETLEEREAGETEAVVGRQLDAVLSGASAEAMGRSLVAYEPVWAIGTGKTASPEQAESVHAFIRARLAAFDTGVASGMRILYGGSVKGSNAAGLFAMANIDGGLIGGAALDAGDFTAICQAAHGQGQK